MENKRDLYISHNEVIADLQATNNVAIFNDIIESARSLLRAGGRVVFTETYDNAPTQELRVFRSIDEFNDWVAEQNEIRAQLEQEPLGS